MPSVSIPGLKGKVYQNVDEIEVSKLSPYLKDGWVDEAGCTHRRPGLDEWIDLGTASPIDGLHYDPNFGALFAVSNGVIYKITDTAGTNSNITIDALAAGSRVSFAHNGTYLVMANGGKIVTYNNTGTTAFIADIDAPTTVRHLAFLDTYILASLVDSKYFYWCDVNDLTAWTATSFASAESLPDKIGTMAVSWREIILGGSQSIEHWYNDGASPFSRIDGAFVERGMSSPFGFVANVDNTLFFVDNEYRICRMDRRTPKVISSAMDRTFQGLTSKTSVYMNHVTADGLNLILCHYYNDDRTFAYDYKNDDWSEWHYWNTATATYNDFLCHTYANCIDWGIHVMGSRLDGKLYKVSSSYYDDDGTVMRTARRSGHVDHDKPSLRKRCNAITFILKRGVGVSGGTQKLMVRFRDDNKQTWSNEAWIDLGDLGDLPVRVTLRNLGMYYTRQWEVVVTDAVPLILVDVIEDFDLLRN